MHSHGLRNLNGRARDPLPRIFCRNRLRAAEPLTLGAGTEPCLTKLTLLRSLSPRGRTGDPPATKETKPMEEET
jgi:hypothetical protein